MNLMNDMRVLYVEDDSDTAEEIIFFLKKRVKELYSAENGAQGYELFVKYHPDIILTDIQMPVMNGLDMSEKIRQTDKQVPIVIISAYNDTNFLTRSISLGVNGYITKPINLLDMSNTIEKVSETQHLKKELEKRNDELCQINENLEAIAKEKTRDLEFLYHHDALTLLHNSVALTEVIQNSEFAYLVLLDIANFANVNKEYGKSFADEVLKAVAKLLQKHSNQDIYLYKIESDKFVFLLKTMTYEEVKEFCSQIHSFFDTKHVFVNDIPIDISFNIGVASFKSKNEVMIHAEYALDIAKTLGARLYFFYDEDNPFVQESKNMIKWLHITKYMIENDNIIPYFQPIFDVKKNKIEKFEVLARGYYDDDIIAPYYFIKPAMQLGLISSITRMIIRKSFERFQNNNFAFSINITERDLYEDYLYDYLSIELKKFDINPSRITLEVLESVTTDNNHQDIIMQINKIKNIGIKIAIDDFGTENANFSRLMDLDFDYIKFDAVYIQDLDKSEKKQLIVKSIVQLAKVLGLETVAEYVENESISKIAKECGVDFLQGYYYGKPSEML